MNRLWVAQLRGVLRLELRKNLFIQPVESEGTWLRYHHLFRDFLQQHFQKEFPEQARTLLRRLVEVYREQGWYEKAHAACILLNDEQVLAEFL